VPNIKDIIEELQFISDRISTQVRTIALGLLAIAWAILVGDSTFLRKLSEGLGKNLLLIACLSIFVLLLDFLQYVVAYIYVDQVRNAAEELKKEDSKNGESNEIDYPVSTLRKFRSAFFWAKQIVLVVTLVFFLLVLACYMFNYS